MPPMPNTLNNLDRPEQIDEDGDEVSTSNNSYTPECATNNSIDHGTESGKSLIFLRLSNLLATDLLLSGIYRVSKHRVDFQF